MEQKLLQTLQKCENFRGLRQTHLQILVRGMHENSLVLPKLIDLASAFHSVNYAIRIFEHAQMPNIVAFNTLIKCFVGKNCRDEPFSAYNRMRDLGIPPNNYTFSFLLKACEAMGSLDGSKQIHAQVVKCGFGFNVFVQNTLLNAYSKCSRELDLARWVFDEMPERDVVSWNSMMGAYMARGDTARAMCLFESMPERNVVSWNSVVAGLAKAGDMALARLVFDGMVNKNTISWNAMISGYVMCGEVGAARSVFDQMGEKNVASWAAMISGYTNIGDLESARKLFDRMPVKNVVSWNVMIAGYNQNCRFDQALRMFRLMLLDGSFQPDEATLVSVVSACGQLGSLDNGNWVYSYIKRSNFHLTNALGNALMDMFAKCGDINFSELVFNQMTRRCIITWTTIISGFAVNGQCREALALFDRMCEEGIEPDDVIFIAVLSACTHGGLVEEGRQIFDQMVGHYGIRPRMEHYGCMVDLLGRAGRLEEAFRFIKSMPMEPNVVIWATLLSSCTMHGGGDLVEFVSQKIVGLEPLDPGYQVLVSNSSARKGMWEGVMDVRATMRQEGIEKVPGCSLIQVGREVHEFLVKDTRHGRREEIYEALDGLTRLMRQVGYMGPKAHRRIYPNQTIHSYQT